jgi:hypothetical protein
MKFTGKVRKCVKSKEMLHLMLFETNFMSLSQYCTFIESYRREVFTGAAAPRHRVRCDRDHRRARPACRGAASVAGRPC